MNIEHNSSNNNKKENFISKNSNSSMNHINKNNNMNSNECVNELLENLKKDFLSLNSDLLNQQLLTKNNLELYRIRTQKEINNTYKFSLKNCISALLPIIDSIERALTLFDEKNEQLYQIFNNLKEVSSTFTKFLLKYGVEIINDINVPFNPDLHQAVTMQLSQDLEENYVILIMQKGYLLNKRLLRPAMVVVSKK